MALRPVQHGTKSHQTNLSCCSAAVNPIHPQHNTQLALVMTDPLAFPSLLPLPTPCPHQECLQKSRYYPACMVLHAITIMVCLASIPPTSLWLESSSGLKQKGRRTLTGGLDGVSGVLNSLKPHHDVDNHDHNSTGPSKSACTSLTLSPHLPFRCNLQG